MSDDVLQWIKESIGSGEILRIVYMGGSRPGSVREIVPLSIFNSGESLWAMDVNPHGKRVRKRFSIEKIMRAKDGQELTSVPEEPEFQVCETFEKLEEVARQLCEAKGILLVRDGDSLKVFEKVKRGDRFKKYPTHKLYFNDEVRVFDEPDETVIGIDLHDGDVKIDYTPGAVVVKKAERPWVMNGRRFKYFTKAAQAFLEQLQ